MIRWLMFATTSLVVLNNCFAQVPAITQISTYAASIGDTIIIQGSNFSNTLSENRVFFGTIEANVSSANANEITVVVPPGTNYEALKVLVNGLAATSIKPVGTKFPSSGAIDSTTFAMSLQLDWGYVLIKRILADMDGDGQLDLVGSREAYDGSVVIQNTSNFATGALSFGAPLSISSGVNYDIYVADLDTDGKPDIIVAGDSGIKIYKNITADTLAFANVIEFESPILSRHLIVCDIDLNGKPDIILSNRENSIAFFLNKSTPGTIDSSSFDTPVIYACPDVPQIIQGGDLNGDGKPEIVISSGYSNSIGHFYIAENKIATPETLPDGSFEWHGPYGKGFHDWLELVDMNGDNALDVVSASAVFQNYATLDNFQFGLPQSIQSISFYQYPTIGDFNGDGRQDVVTGNTMEALRNKSIDSVSIHRPVDLKIPIVSLGGISGDLNGDGKTDLLMRPLSSDGTSFFALQVLLNQSEPLPDPTIDSIQPDTVVAGTTVIIRGANFGYVHHNNSVTFNGEEVAINYGNTTELYVTVPYGASDGYFTVNANGVKSVTTDQLVTIISPPLIDRLEPNVAAAGEAIVIRGAHFDNKSPIHNNVFFGGVKAEVLEASDTALIVQVPFGAAQGPVSVQARGITATSIDHFTLHYPLGGRLEKHSFTRFSYPVNGYPANKLKLADVDLDGKQDIILARAGGITIYRNSSTIGALTSSSFADSVVIAYSNDINNVQVADVDADGKLDLIVQANGFTIHHNNSTPGNIAFNLPVNFSMISEPNDFFVTDIDVDGKPDIVFGVDDYNSSEEQNPFMVWICRNISLPGVINRYSFAEPRHFFTSPGYCSDFAIADINKDYKPDVITMTVNSWGSYVHIFQNQSRPDSLGIAEAYLSRGYTKTNDIATADLNNDSVMEIIGASWLSFNSYILSTNDTIDNIATTAFTETDLGNRAYKVAIADMDGDGKADILFAHQEILIKRNQTSGAITSSAFESSIAIPGNFLELEVADLDGDGLNDMVGLGYDSLTVYHNLNQPTPFITSFSPKKAKEETDVTVTGGNFSPAADSNLVKINEMVVEVKSATDSTLIFTVPVGAADGIISVSVDGLKGFSADTLSIIKKQTITFDSIPATQYGIENIYMILTATSSSGLPVTYTSSVDSVAVVNSAVIYEYLMLMGAGTTTITARQEGNDLYAAAEPVTRTLVVKKGLAEIVTAMDEVASDVYEDDEPIHTYAYMAVLGPPIALNFESSNHAVATIADTVITVHGPGTAEISFWHEGNDDYEPDGKTYELVVKARSQVITFDEIPFKDNLSEPFSINVSASSGLPVIVTSTNTEVATLTDNMVTIHNPGETSLTATQEGNFIYPPAEPVTRILRVALITATETNTMRDVRLSPNPTTGIVKVQTTRQFSPAAIIRVIDARGIVLVQQPFNNEANEIDLHDLNTGLYLFEISDQDFVQYDRIMRQ